ncbi:MAG: hypothetical protein H6Q10_3574 [Acidobacteria bacterium]|nr:hypothetical protein [Acidobacteriota bacterium]
MVIKSIGPVSCAKVAAVLYGGMGLIAGALVSLASLAGGFSSSDTGGAAIGLLFGMGAIVLMPILYGVLGFVVTLVGAWLYNVAAGAVGGIEIDMS